eukprot:CAMPEP_0196572928 /NCGR_PEP_ID=MMETSP1081-20130531/2897_1 /TAXON_ID=36882 /ORGANISM="Pyramimonas amylifera, Strain CCMP720" /LENGTH=55 /DNA_ID=CAMNT_0041890435 /DNA_START=355 /DNA_END=518 /DNA_ORIENTATION=+
MTPWAFDEVSSNKAMSASKAAPPQRQEQLVNAQSQTYNSSHNSVVRDAKQWHPIA